MSNLIAHRPRQMQASIRPVATRRYVDMETGEIVEIVPFSRNYRQRGSRSGMWHYQTLLRELGPIFVLVIAVFVMLTWGR